MKLFYMTFVLCPRRLHSIHSFTVFTCPTLTSCHKPVWFMFLLHVSVFLIPKALVLTSLLLHVNKALLLFQIVCTPLSCTFDLSENIIVNTVQDDNTQEPCTC